MIAFWILAPIMVLAALGILFVRKAVHAALLLAVVMISLAVLYAVLDAPFLFAVQIIVYTGAILMLFLFVLMLVGVDASDSVVETIRGQRLMATVVGLLLRRWCWCSASARSPSARSSGSTRPTPTATSRASPSCCSPSYVFAFEATSALLITAALGAMVLAHRERLTPKPTQARPGRAADARLRRRTASTRPAAAARRVRPAQRGRHPGAAARRHRRRRPRSRGCWPPAARSGPRRRSADDVARSSSRRSASARRRPRRAATRPRPTRRTGMSATPFLVLSAILFTIGCVGVLTRRNAIVVFMCVELMLNASQPRAGHLRRESTATSTARSRPSS